MVDESITIREIRIPDSLDDADAGDFIGVVEARNAVHAELSGNHDEDVPPAQLLSNAHTPTVVKRQWAVTDGDAIVGRVLHDVPQDAGSTEAYVETLLPKRYWNRGIGSAVHEILVDATRAAGRSVMQAWTEHRANEGLDRLAAPTGFGSIPLDHAARFLDRHGYRLEQIERASILNLTATGERIAEHTQAARRAARGFHTVHWIGDTPREHVAGLAHMKNRMSTDAPAAGMEWAEERWDAERVADHDRMNRESGLIHLTVVAIEDSTGEPCGYTEIATNPASVELADQGDTLILREFRGHRLGMLLKCRALELWAELAPETARIRTWNAEENRPMLDINEALGFFADSYSGGWQLHL